MKKDTPAEHIRHTITLKPGEKVALCRCWRSKKFPLCDGSHRQDNHSQGPVIVEGKPND